MKCSLRNLISDTITRVFKEIFGSSAMRAHRPGSAFAANLFIASAAREMTNQSFS